MKAWRLARADGAPAYTVMSNATLERACALRPTESRRWPPGGGGIARAGARAEPGPARRIERPAGAGECPGADRHTQVGRAQGRDRRERASHRGDLRRRPVPPAPGWGAGRA